MSSVQQFEAPVASWNPDSQDLRSWKALWREASDDPLVFLGWFVLTADQHDKANPERLHENATLYMQARGKGPADRQALPVPPGNMYRDELELFADSVASGRDCELSAANGCQAVAAVYAALKSAGEGSRAVPLSEVIEMAQAQLPGATGPRHGAAGRR